MFKQKKVFNTRVRTLFILNFPCEQAAQVEKVQLALTALNDRCNFLLQNSLKLHMLGFDLPHNFFPGVQAHFQPTIRPSIVVTALEQTTSTIDVNVLHSPDVIQMDDREFQRIIPLSTIDVNVLDSDVIQMDDQIYPSDDVIMNQVSEGLSSGKRKADEVEQIQANGCQQPTGAGSSCKYNVVGTNVVPGKYSASRHFDTWYYS